LAARTPSPPTPSSTTSSGCVTCWGLDYTLSLGCLEAKGLTATKKSFCCLLTPSSMSPSTQWSTPP
jgi:hypothetical protein